MPKHESSGPFGITLRDVIEQQIVFICGLLETADIDKLL
jgi:hypothetical protein